MTSPQNLKTKSDNVVKTVGPKAPSPMLKQYQTIKAKHQDCLLLFRLGDFYELFYEDAKVAAKQLDLVLTSRGKAPSDKIPMCGVPFHAADNYIPRLIKAGFKVAICEQLEDPSASKGIVKRDVVRILSAGTFLDEQNAQERLIIALSPNQNQIGFALCDVTQGLIETNELTFQTSRILDLILKKDVFEIVFPESQEKTLSQILTHPLLKTKNVTLSPVADWSFDAQMAKQALLKHFSVSHLTGFGIENLHSAISATGGLLSYVKNMNKQEIKHFDRIALFNDEDYCIISSAAHQGLELRTLLKTCDHTKTAFGKRLLTRWLTHPLKNPLDIAQRQDAIRLLIENATRQNTLKEHLSQTPDIEKQLSRLSCGYLHARDLLGLRNTLKRFPDWIKSLEPLKNKNALFALEDVPHIRERLVSTLQEDIPLAKPEGKIIAPGIDPELDELKKIRTSGNEWLAAFQEQEIQKTKIPSLKVGFNKVFGYYIEVTKVHQKNVPPHYIRKQTLTNAERYITDELKTYEEKILSAQDKIAAIEDRIIKELQQEILSASKELHQAINALAQLDCLFSLSVLAQKPGYICPEVNDTTTIAIHDGRHPVVENTIEDEFIANDTQINCDNEHLIILTGPNMAGKSTYIRQIAILIIMAQTGSYIPAKSARIGIVDKIFTRIGAHDDISKGQSTFMVEMSETAEIVNNLTNRSLVILDEIGRGTSTYDGLSLAWSLAEFFQKTKVRTLFATHFHELTALANEYPGVKNYNVAVKEWNDQIIFMHKIIPGHADDSYGIYVAKLAGIPENVIGRAKQLLTQLEGKTNLADSLLKKQSQEEQISLFQKEKTPSPDPILSEIENIDINDMTTHVRLEPNQRMAKTKKVIMKRVHVLPEEIIAKIAAGEVIDRPASVIKELVENSIDAGSTSIEVTLKDAGKKLIVVKDNGSGIDQEDLETIFHRHATSKIKSSEDLFDIHSLGFRGEALYSIGAVSQVTVNSKTKDSDSGWSIEYQGGEKTSFQPCALNDQGTEMIIQELFFNTPARKKFLKSNSAESHQILNHFIPYCLLHHDTRFQLIHQDKTLVDCAPATDHRTRIAHVLGLDEKHIQTEQREYGDQNMSVKLFLGDINIQRSRRDLQHLFINGPPCSKQITSAIT